MKLARIRERNALNLLDDQLTDRSSREEIDGIRPQVDQLKRDGAAESSMDGWSGEMNQEAASCIRAPALDPGSETTRTGLDRQGDALKGLGQHVSARAQDEGLLVVDLSLLRVPF